MSTESREIQEALRKLVGVNDTWFVGTVESVDEDNRQCKVVSVLDGEEVTYDEVNLSPERNDGLIQIPAVDSTVICKILPGGESYVFLPSDIDKLICYINNTNEFEFSSSGFVLNQGTFGGLIKIDNLKTQYDNNIAAIKTAVVAALTLIDTQLIALGQAGGSAAAFTTSATSIVNLVKATLENTKFKH